MNMCDITFEVTRLNTFVFKKSSEKKYSRLYSWLRAEKVLAGPASQMVAQHCFKIGPMYRVIRVVAYRGLKCQCTPMTVRANTGQSPNSVSMLGQRRIRLTGIEPAMGCDAGPTSNRYWVGRPTLLYQVHRIDAYTDLSAMVVEEIGLHVEDILVSLILSIIISGTFKILALKGNLMFAKY